MSVLPRDWGWGTDDMKKDESEEQKVRRGDMGPLENCGLRSLTIGIYIGEDNGPRFQRDRQMIKCQEA